MMWDGLLQALGAAGTVLDTPGSVARGLLSAQAGRAFGGILDPEQRVYGEEWTGDPWSGLAVDMATDPLNLLGGVGLLKTARAAKFAKAHNARRAELLASGGMPEEIAKLTKIVDESGNPLRTYHGTGSSFDNFDMAKANPNSLYGKGIYTTADPELASTYAENALNDLLPTPDAPAGDIANVFRQSILADSTADPRWKSYLAKLADQDIVDEAAQFAPNPYAIELGKVTPDDLSPVSRAVAPLFKWDVPPANVRAQFIDARNPLNLDKRIPGKQARAIHEAAVNAAAPSFDEFVPLDAVKGRTGSEVYKSLADMFGGDKTALNEAIRSAGYDAMLHTGGRVTGGRPHQVAIALDPSQIYSPWIAPAARNVPRQSPLLAALLGYNAVRGSRDPMGGG